MPMLTSLLCDPPTGRFLGALLEIISKWHSSGATYAQVRRLPEATLLAGSHRQSINQDQWQLCSHTHVYWLFFSFQECAKTPGFISMMRSSGSGNEKQYLDYENYRHITFKWHFKLTKSLVVLLESKDYMQVMYMTLQTTLSQEHCPARWCYFL